MMSNRYYIGECLETVCGLMADVSQNVFAGHRPGAVGEQIKDFVVISLPVTIYNKNVQQLTTIRIEIATRNKATGIANIARLQEMLDALMAKFPIVERRFSVTSPNLVLKGNDGLGFTLWNVQAKLLVNTTDSYKNNQQQTI